MSKNNYFYYTEQHYEFLNYLMSFAMDEYKDEDPMLSDCAKELIRYILKLGKTESVAVTKLDQTVITVNYDKFIKFSDCFSCEPRLNPQNDFKNWYFVSYDPFSFFDTRDNGERYITYLSMKKLKEICSKYKSSNQIFLQHVQYINEKKNMIDTTLFTPMKQWEEDDYQRFILHLLEESIIDMSRRIVWEINPMYTCGLYWYFISKENLEKMGVRNHIDDICLHNRANTINICFTPSSENDDFYANKLRSFVNNINPLPLFFDLSDYKEKMKYAESIMDRLVAEFRL